MALIFLNPLIEEAARDLKGMDIDWLEVIQVFGPILIGILAIWFSYWQVKRALKETRKQYERDEIYKKLNEFYGPFLQLRKKSYLLYNKLRYKYRQDDPNFRTLTYLLSGKQFKDNDLILLKEIITIGQQCEDLIHTKAGLIDDSDLRVKILPRATSHYLILRLAFKGDLSGEETRFEENIFPKELDERVEKRFKELEEKLRELYSASKKTSSF
jgi:hypothetical protein